MRLRCRLPGIKFPPHGRAGWQLPGTAVPRKLRGAQDLSSALNLPREGAFG